MNDHVGTSAAVAVRVGYLLKMFPRLSETFILNEILELEQQGLDLHIFSLKRPADAVVHAQAKSVRSPITYLPEKIYQTPMRVLRCHWHVYWKHPRTWTRTLRHALRRLRVDRDLDALIVFCQACCIIREMGGIPHLHAHYATIPAKLALLVHRITGTSYSITTHAKDIFQDNPLLSPKLHERICRARFVVANSRFSADHLRTYVTGQDAIHIVYNGLALEAFPFRKTTPAEPRILSVGRLVEKKGFADLITACQLLKARGIPFSCELVGTGQLSSAIKEQIRKCGVGDRVSMVGPLPQEVLRAHYEQAMVFTLPCIEAADGDRDILPNVIKEAMAVGVPVVTTRLDGIEELLEDNVSGLLVEPGDPAELAAKLELVLCDLGLRRRLAVEGRRTIEERFDRRGNFGRLKTLLNEAIRGPRGAASRTAETAQCYDARCLH